MRILIVLPLLLLVVPGAALAARGDPLICDPPPDTTLPCPPGASEAHYIVSKKFEHVPQIDLEDLCTTSHTVLDGNRGEPSWTRICEAIDEAPRVQLLCREQPDHSISCDASPRDDGFIYLWESKHRVIAADAETDPGSGSTSFVCRRAGVGTIALTISKPGGATTTAVSDVKCTGAYAPRNAR